MWTLLGIAATSLIGLIVVLLSYRSSRGPRITVARAVPDDGEVLAYIASYLVPFFGIDLGSSDDLVVFVTFLAVLGIVYVNSNMLLVNPILSVIGFHAFRVVDIEGHEYHVFTRRRELNAGLIFRPSQVDTYLRIEARRD